MDATLSFGERTFSHLDLGDKRRTARLVHSADAMCRHPGGTLPDKFPKPADLRGFYRLMNRAAVTHELLMQAHTSDTQRIGRRRVSVEEPVTVRIRRQTQRGAEEGRRQSLPRQ